MQYSTSAAEIQSEAATSQTGLPLVHPQWQEGVAVFRQAWQLRLPLAGRGESLKLLPQSGLNLHFASAAAEIDAADEDWVARWDESDQQRVRISLKRPATLRRVLCDAYDKIALLRADGDAVSDEPAISGRTHHLLGELIQAGDFVLALSEPSATAEKIAKRSARKARQAESKSARAAKPGAASAVEKAKEALREAIERDSWLSLEVFGTPTSPRLKLLDAAGEPLWQWQLAGAQQSADFVSGQGDLDALEDALNRALARLDGNAPALELQLLAESDEPCRLRVNQLQLQAQWQRSALPAPLDALRFCGQSLERRSVPLDTPCGVPFSLALSLSPALPAVGAAAPAMPGGRSGLFLRAGQDAAAPMQLGSPLFVHGGALAWWPLSSSALLHLRLHQDADGAPGGLLAEATLRHSPDGADSWLFRWEKTPLQAGCYWWCLHCEDGEGVWLGAPGSEQRALERREGEPWRALSLPLALAIAPLGDGSGSASLSAEVNGSPLQLQALDSGRLLASAALPAATGGAELQVVSSQPLLLTVAEAAASWPARLECEPVP